MFFVIFKNLLENPIVNLNIFCNFNPLPQIYRSLAKSEETLMNFPNQLKNC